MSQTLAKHQLETLIRTAFDDGRCGEYYLVDLEISPSGHVSVFVDGDAGISLDACVRISRILQAILDAEPAIEGQYAMEVSSPGVSRPLKYLRQYTKHAGRTILVELTDGRKMEGVLTGTGHDRITLDVRTGDKKARPQATEIPFNTIAGAYVLVKFGK